MRDEYRSGGDQATVGRGGDEPRRGNKQPRAGLTECSKHDAGFRSHPQERCSFGCPTGLFL